MDHAVGWTWTGFGPVDREEASCLAEAVMLIEGQGGGPRDVLRTSHTV